MGTDNYSETKLDELMDSLTHQELQLLARGALMAAQTAGRNQDRGPEWDQMEVPDLYDEMVADLNFQLPDRIPMIKNGGRLSANWWRDLVGMPLLDEDGEEIRYGDWSIVITHPDGSLWTEDDLHWEDAARHAHEHVEHRLDIEEDGGLAEIITDIQHAISVDGGGATEREYHGFTIWMKGGVI